MKMSNSKNENQRGVVSTDTPSAGEAVEIFNSEKFGIIRTAGTADNPLFCLADVCKALDLQTNIVARRLERGVLSKHPLPTSGGNQVANFVNEDGLYDVILDSRKPEAKAFRKWITSEILPAIRKSGGYMVAAVEETPEQIMARALKVADETMRRQQAQIQAANDTITRQTEEIKTLAPLADYTKEVLQSNATYTLTQVSKDLGFASVYKFTAWAHLAGILYYQSGQWMPMSRYTGRGWFTTRTCKFVKTDGSIGSNISTVVTEAGRAMLHNALLQWQRRTAAETTASRKAQPAQPKQPAQPEPVFHIDPNWRPSETVIIEEGGAR